MEEHDGWVARRPTGKGQCPGKRGAVATEADSFLTRIVLLRLCLSSTGTSAEVESRGDENSGRQRPRAARHAHSQRNSGHNLWCEPAERFRCPSQEDTSP